MRTTDKIQVSISIGIWLTLVATIILTIVNACQQTEFHRQALRPVVSAWPDSLIDIEHGNYVKYGYSLRNDGQGPAYRLASYSTLTLFDKKFPVADFRQMIKGGEPTVTAFMYPGQCSLGVKTGKEVFVDSLDSEGRVVSRRPASKCEITGAISSGDAFIHAYLIYSDFMREAYYFRCTYLMRPLEDWKRGDWVPVDASEEKIDP